MVQLTAVKQIPGPGVKLVEDEQKRCAQLQKVDTVLSRCLRRILKTRWQDRITNWGSLSNGWRGKINSMTMSARDVGDLSDKNRGTTVEQH